MTHGVLMEALPRRNRQSTHPLRGSSAYSVLSTDEKYKACSVPTVEEVIEHTGFDFDRPKHVPETPAPTDATLALMRETVAPQLAEVYPQFAAKIFGVGTAAFAG